MKYEDYTKYALFDWKTNEKDIVGYLMSKDDTLALRYHFIQQLMESVKSHSYHDFIQILEETKKYTFPKKVRTTFNTLFNYRYEIENSLKYTLSNGCVEGTNNKIKNIKRSGYGYRNFYHLRTRILLPTDMNKIKNEEYQLLIFSEEEAAKQYNTEYEKALKSNQNVA